MCYLKYLEKFLLSLIWVSNGHEEKVFHIVLVSLLKEEVECYHRCFFLSLIRCELEKKAGIYSCDDVEISMRTKFYSKQYNASTD